MAVREDGQDALTVATPVRVEDDFSVLDLRLMTGRTHQIRVHLAHAGHPVLGDDKYGDFALNKVLAGRGVKRLFLHAASLAFRHPATGRRLSLRAPLPADMQEFLDAR
mgnify:CR=1 FL=1